MTAVVVMPALGESVTEGTVTRWLKSPGDPVESGEPLLEVSTDKVDTTIEAPCSGILTLILVPEEVTVVVGTELARIAPPGEAETAPTDAVAEGTAATARVIAEPPESLERPTPTPESPYVTPAVRALLRTRSVDISTIVGSGRGGRITRRDVLASLAATSKATHPEQMPASAEAAGFTEVAAAPQATPVPGSSSGRTEKLTRLRSTIATRMMDSLRVSAQLTTVVEADLTRTARVREDYNGRHAESGRPTLSFLPFVAESACRALLAHPVLNATIDTDAGTVTYHDTVDLGIAVDTERGLLVPVIRSAGDLNVEGLSRRITDLAQRTRDSQVSADELSGGTFTITNTGSRGALFDTPIINQPQVAILGLGAITRRPVAVTLDTGQEALAIRSMAYLALTYDHRLVDGADAARFLSTLTARVESASLNGVSV